MIRSVNAPELRFDQNDYIPERSTVAQVLVALGSNGQSPASSHNFYWLQQGLRHHTKRRDDQYTQSLGHSTNTPVGNRANVYQDTGQSCLIRQRKWNGWCYERGSTRRHTSTIVTTIVLDHSLRKAMNGKEEELDFTITSRKSSRHSKEVLADLDFADDIACQIR